MNVITSYQISLNAYVQKILVLIAGLVILSFLVWFLTRTPKGSKKRVWWRNALLVIFCISVYYWGYGSNNPVKPAKTITWSWYLAYHEYGYVPCTLETFALSTNVVTRPEGYSEEHISQISFSESPAEQEYDRPDILLILNESFYDLRQITDLMEDAPFLEHLEGMERLLTGYAVVPNSGGSTNASEYELLTSNSLQLMPGVTPFNALDLTDANSVVSHMNALGYNTLGAHCMDSSNYSRKVGYDALGFDEIYFDEDFSIIEYIPGRGYNSDKANYENVIQWYDAMPEDQGRFLYLLTIQNHGDWNQSPAENDTIHAQTDYGEYDAIVDEYLTCIDYSDIAFQYLTDHFSSVERPVIICMVGDHSPNFAGNIADSKYSAEEQELLLRRVPMVIWANFDLEVQELGTMSMNYVVPTLLEMANVERSAYYDYILEMKQQVPVISSYGKYYDTEGNQYDYDQDTGLPYEALVNDYFYLEYHNISGKTNREIYIPGNQN